MPTATRPGKRRQASRTTSGSAKAAVPKMTRSAPSSQQLRGPFDAAHAAADLDRDRQRAAQRRNRGAVHRQAAHRAVEVDDVQVLRALVHPTLADGDGIVAVHRLGAHVAAQQAHTLAALQVDGRYDLQHSAYRSVPLLTKEGSGEVASATNAPKFSQNLQPDGLALLRVELRGEDVVARDHRAELDAVVGRRWRSATRSVGTT